MSLLGLIARWRKGSQLVELSDALAIQSLESVWPLVEERVGELNSHQLRGYVRARSRGIVRELAQRLVVEQGRRITECTEDLLDLTTTGLVKLIVTRHRTLMANRSL